MHKNPFWLGFLIIVALSVLWCTGNAVYKYYQYSALSSEIPAKQVLWTVFHKSSDQYQLKAEYTFAVEEKDFKGETLLPTPLFRNPWAAEDALKEYMQLPWKIWYSPNKPTASTIDKRFPYKEIISTTVLWVLLAYFIGLGYYVARFQRRT